MEIGRFRFRLKLTNYGLLIKWIYKVFLGKVKGEIFPKEWGKNKGRLFRLLLGAKI
jgi:hypothetical protein